MLLGEIVDRDRFRAGDSFGPGQAGSDDRRRRLVGAAQIACHPDRVARQLLGEPSESGAFRAIARKVQLSIDAAAMVYRRVADPPKAGRDLVHFAAAVSSTTISPICWKAPRTSPV
jgi:hypothetical protein